MAAEPAPFPFMKLPGELRNRVYRLALIDSSRIRITMRGVEEPGLLMVSKQVRHETVPLFWTENQFTLRVNAYNPTAIVFFVTKYKSLLRAHHLNLREIDISLSGPFTPNWTNLLEWLRQVHANEGVFGPSIVSVRPASRWSVLPNLVAAMFGSVEQLRDKPWTEVEAMMSMYRPALADLEDAWEN